MKIIPDHYVGATLLCIALMMPFATLGPPFLLPAATTLEVTGLSQQDLEHLMADPQLSLVSSAQSELNKEVRPLFQNEDAVKFLLPYQFGFESLKMPSDLASEPLLRNHSFVLGRTPHKNHQQLTWLLLFLSGALGFSLVWFDRRKSHGKFIS